MIDLKAFETEASSALIHVSTNVPKIAKSIIEASEMSEVSLSLTKMLCRLRQHDQSITLKIQDNVVLLESTSLVDIKKVANDLIDNYCRPISNFGIMYSFKDRLVPRKYTLKVSFIPLLNEEREIILRTIKRGEQAIC